MHILLLPLYSQENVAGDSTVSQVQNKPQLTLSGGTRLSAFFAGNTYDYPSFFSEFQLKSQFQFQNVGFHTDLRLRTGIQFDSTVNEIEVKDLNVSYQVGKLRFNAGNQIVVWGRTDGFTAVNYLTPVNYFFLSSDPDDQLMSNLMIRLRYQMNKHIDIDLVGIPLYKPSVYRYDLFKINEYVDFGETILPDREFAHASLAGRVNFEFSAAGFSLSYFQGYDPFHGFNLKQFNLSLTGIEILNNPEPYFKRSAGFDFELPAGSTMLRGEVSYNHTQDYIERMFVPNPDLSYVAAFERDIAGITAVVQYVGKYTLNFSRLMLPDLSQYDLNNPSDMMRYAEDYMIYEMTLFNRKIFHQENQADHALMLILANSFLYETLDVEFSTYYNFTTDELMLRPGLQLKTNDHLSFSLGGIYMHGPKNSLFDYSGKILSGLFAEMNVQF